ncbi:LysR family transcriptional regulator [Vibrio nitrifigilis]|uniref:LysR family transcriptional regulator n=1 Tax=Vibrio nitrifigilis TaxID=2789781 RepID=A0ABS0GJ54_9VIBR|nr:LysR substrate-binding domain-containing protein [Vibrio nitrifigilis]MBF9002360.1 LysR family transcriptional regulator [Vibrio nitrifigilis]
MLEIKPMRYFIAIAEELHFGRAAKRLHIVQPALSMQIKKLEETLGANLLIRNRHQVSLTPIGELFYKEAIDIVARTERLATRVGLASQGEIGQLKIGVSASALTSEILPNLIKRFKTLYPHIQVELKEVHPATQQKSLLTREVDIVIGPSQVFAGVQDKVNGIYLSQFGFKLACSDEHSLAKHNRVDVESLQQETFVGLSADEDVLGMMVTGFALPFIPRHSIQVKSTAALFSVVESNLGVAIVSSALERTAPPNLVFLDLEGIENNMPIYAFTRHSDQDPVLHHFNELILNQC